MWITLDKTSPQPMLRQVYGAFREAVLSGRLAAGTKLPSTRELASELAVSRNVVLEAYELLLAEGFIEGKPGSGTYVAEGARLPGYEEGGARSSSGPDGGEGWAERADDGEGDVISFRTGLPALDLFPKGQWAACLQQVCLEAGERELGYGDPAGDPELRRVLAEYLARSRGMEVHPQRIVITGGAVQGLQLAAQLLLGAGDRVLVEDPTNRDLLQILSSTGAGIVPVPVDDAGLRAEELDRLSGGREGRPKAVYVTPSHQFPLGGILPVQRRIELIGFAERTGCCLLEDDYDSEFCMDGPPLHALHSLAPERVVYIGTFSKMLFPALRIGYAVLPAALREPFIRLKRLSDYQTPVLEQRALARFIQSGRLASHVRKMKKVYRKRRETLLYCLEEQLGPDGFRVYGRAAGLHLAVELARPLPEGWRERLHAERVYAAEPDAVPVKGADGYPAAAVPAGEVEGCLFEGEEAPGGTEAKRKRAAASASPGRRIILGYGHLSEERLREGISRLVRTFG